MLPEAASKALAMLNQPNCSIGHFAGIVEQDVSLASSILALANSPFYSVGRPVGNVREAVVLVGFRQCQSLIHASCANSLMSRLSDGQAQSNRVLLIHSRMTAAAAVEINSVFKLDLKGAEFTAGILHDIGRILLFSLMPEKYCVADDVSLIEKDWTPEPETNAVGSDHCAVGCMFGILNSLPEHICEAIRFHHSPEKAKICPLLAAVTAAADDYANFLLSDRDTEYDSSDNSGLRIIYENAIDNLGLAPDACSEIVLSKLRSNWKTNAN